MINIALLGFGTVGSGCAEVLTTIKDKIEAQIGDNISIKYILDLRDFPDSPFADIIIHDFNIILNDPEVSVVAEMMGGSHPAYDFTKALLSAGKSVVTSNKEVVSTFGVELLDIAASNNVRYLFEASVGGGIPIIRPLANDLAANDIISIDGILNGTTNFILTKMKNDGLDFESVLKEAQSLGYAEANPSADVDGIDAARKIAILGAMACGRLVDPNAIPTQGIRNVTADDIELALQGGYSIKLIGHYEMLPDGKPSLSVAPKFVPNNSPLATIDDVFNGVLVCGNMLGDSMFYGKGAGKLPTASAVCADIIDAIKNPSQGKVPIKWVNEQSIPDSIEISTKVCVIAKIGSKASELSREIASCSTHYFRTDSCSAVITDKPVSHSEINNIEAADGFIKIYSVL